LNLRKEVDGESIAAIKEQFGSLLPREARFDVFLSHAASAADKALGIWQILTAPPYKFRVYMDWIHDPLMERQTVNEKTASTLRMRMQASQCLIYVVTESSQKSVWMPWELGYFDAYKANIGILPVVEDDKKAFFGREYLSLYKQLTLDDTAAMARQKFPATNQEAISGMLKLAEVAKLNMAAFARQMQDEPQLAGEWLRPHAEDTIEQGPELATSNPGQATEEVKSVYSIYGDEWIKMLRRMFGG
jgi:hypothetical protein